MARSIGWLLFFIAGGLLSAGALFAQAPPPAPTACEIQLQVVESGRKQAEASMAALYVEVQALRKQVADEAVAKKAAETKPAEKK